MRTCIPLALSLLSLAVTLTACGNTAAVSPGGGSVGDGATGLSGTQQDVADRVAAADQAAAALTQVLGPTVDAAIAAQTQATGASARTMQTADELLEQCLGTGTVQIGLQLSPPGYVVTVTNGRLFSGTVPVNGTLSITGTLATDPRVVTVATSGFTLGQCTVTGTVIVNVAAAGGAVTIVADDMVVAWQGTDLVSEFDLNATAAATDDGGYVIDGTLVVSIEGISGTESAQVTVAAQGVTASPTSTYPSAGTLTFACGGKQLTVTFTGGSTVTVSDGEGHSANVVLPPLI